MAPVTSMSRPPSLTSLAYSRAYLISIVTITPLSTTIDLSTSINSIVYGSITGPEPLVTHSVAHLITFVALLLSQACLRLLSARVTSFTSCDA